MPVHGGMGYLEEYALERIFRDAGVTRSRGGTNEMQKLPIARESLKD